MPVGVQDVGRRAVDVDQSAELRSGFGAGAEAASLICGMGQADRLFFTSTVLQVMNCA